ncbi:hypothetical protein ACLOJK_001840 [Asimina triloba]
MAGDVSTAISNGNTNMQHDPQRTFQVVVAATWNMGIGKDGKLPWNLPSDMKFFKEITLVTADPLKKNAVIMGRKTWESIPVDHRPLPGRLNVVLTRSGSFDIATAENVVICGSMNSALELLAASPYCFSIEKVFVIGGGQLSKLVSVNVPLDDVNCREAQNSSGCDAIHITEIETSIDCDTFIPPIDLSVFQPWYSSFPLVENNIRYSFVAYVRVRHSITAPVGMHNGLLTNTNPDNVSFEVEKFSFLPKKIFERHEEYLYLKLVQDIISSGAQKGDRTGTGTLSKFGCQMRFNLRKSFPLLTTKVLLFLLKFDFSFLFCILWFKDECVLVPLCLIESTCVVHYTLVAQLMQRYNYVNVRGVVFSILMLLRGSLDACNALCAKICVRDVEDMRSFKMEMWVEVYHNGINWWYEATLRLMVAHGKCSVGIVKLISIIGLTDREEGDLGPIYGFQWRHFGATYTDMHADYTGKGFDQLLDVIDKIKNNPNDRRIILSAWNPSDLKLMALPPCHTSAQFYVANGELSCQMYQRSADMGLGVPFNIASYSLLTSIIAHVCDLVPGDFIHVLGDTHVYNTHVRPLEEQLQKLPRPFPILKINPQKKDIDSFVASDFKLIGYNPHQKIEMKMAI